MAESISKRAQVARWIRLLVEAEKLQPGDRIPASVVIAERLGCSKRTADAGVQRLVDEGVLQRFESNRRGVIVARDGHDPRPVRCRVADLLRDQIRDGRFQEGDRLPTVAALARNVGVAKEAARRALLMLRDEGLVHVGRRGSSVRAGALTSAMEPPAAHRPQL